MTFGSVFAGIGGFDLGFERAGLVCKWQIEIDPFCEAVLKAHWPGVARYHDANTVDGAQLEAVDVICGGWPCQPHSKIGHQRGADDERDGWPAFIRLVRAARPGWVVAENVPTVLGSDAGRYFGTVLSDLAASGYDAEWDCLPACAVGAPHERDRLVLVAYPRRERLEGVEPHRATPGAARRSSGSAARVDPLLVLRRVALHDPRHTCERVPVPFGRRMVERPLRGPGPWATLDPGMFRVVHGVPQRMERLRALGNAIVPQLAEALGRALVDADRELRA